MGSLYFNNFYTSNCPNGDILVIILMILFGFLKQIFIIFDHFLYVYTEIIRKNLLKKTKIAPKMPKKTSHFGGLAFFRFS